MSKRLILFLIFFLLTDSQIISELEEGHLEKDLACKVADTSASLESLESLLSRSSFWLWRDGKLKQKSFSTTDLMRDDSSNESLRSFSSEDSYDEQTESNFFSLTPDQNPTLSSSHFENSSKGNREDFESRSLLLNDSADSEDRKQKRKKVRFKEDVNFGPNLHCRVLPESEAVEDKTQVNCIGKYFLIINDTFYHPIQMQSNFINQNMNTYIFFFYIENDSSLENYPLALKMMFNYETESNAPAILTAMYRELLPARVIHFDDSSPTWIKRYILYNCVGVKEYPYCE